MTQKVVCLCLSLSLTHGRTWLLGMPSLVAVFLFSRSQGDKLNAALQIFSSCAHTKFLPLLTDECFIMLYAFCSLTFSTFKYICIYILSLHRLFNMQQVEHINLFLRSRKAITVCQVCQGFRKEAVYHSKMSLTFEVTGKINQHSRL